MVSNISSCTKVLVLPIVLWVVSSFSLRAQEKDFATWANAGFEYKLKPAFTVSGGLEWRTKDDLGKTDQLAAAHAPPPPKRGADGWKFRHRYRLEGTLSARVQRVKLSLRERFQHTFDGHRDEFRLRSRAKFAYDIPKCKLEPYASAEMYNGLNKTEHFGVKRMRYRGGITLPLSERWEADIFYCRQWEKDKRKDIVGVECVYSF